MSQQTQPPPDRRTFRAVTRGVALPSVTGAGLAAVLVIGSVVPAYADVPEGWSDPAPVSPLDLLWVIVGIPVIVAVLITLAVVLPGIARGGRIGVRGNEEPGSQWIGGPQRGAHELAAPDTEESRAGGASARW